MTWIIGDCLEVLPTIPAGSVDLVLADLPYMNGAEVHWDTSVHLPTLWRELNRVLVPNGTVLLTASQPFSSLLVTSNLKQFKYDWVWRKTKATGHAHAKNAVMRAHEAILVFSKGSVVHAGKSVNRMVFNPQGLVLKDKPTIRRARGPQQNNSVVFAQRPSHKDTLNEYGGYPTSVVDFDTENGKRIHPTQKPVDLFEYFISTYSNEGATVLDVTAGSGTTAIAAINTSRRWICIEKDAGFSALAQQRIKLHVGATA